MGKNHKIITSKLTCKCKSIRLDDTINTDYNLHTVVATHPLLEHGSVNDRELGKKRSD
jgi:hypothetical protein